MFLESEADFWKEWARSGRSPAAARCKGALPPANGEDQKVVPPEKLNRLVTS
jgi:hypothetical protein